MRLGAGSTGRRWVGLLVLGLAVATQAGVTPGRAAVIEVPRAAAHAAVTWPGLASKPAAAIKPTKRTFGVDPAEHAWRARFLAHPVSAPSATAAQAAASRHRSATAPGGLARAGVSACSGQITADTVYSCQSPSNTGTDTYTLTLGTSADALVFQTHRFER